MGKTAMIRVQLTKIGLSYLVYTCHSFCVLPMWTPVICFLAPYMKKHPISAYVPWWEHGIFAMMSALSTLTLRGGMTIQFSGKINMFWQWHIWLKNSLGMRPFLWIAVRWNHSHVQSVETDWDWSMELLHLVFIDTLWIPLGICSVCYWTWPSRHSEFPK